MQPLGLKNINMFPTAEMKKNLAFMHQRWPGSEAAEERDHIYREPIIAESEHEKKHIFHSGGAGAYAKPSEYVQVLAALLNDGKSPTTGAQILRPETVKAMFENQVRQMQRSVLSKQACTTMEASAHVYHRRSLTFPTSREWEFLRPNQTKRIQLQNCIHRRASRRKDGA